MSKSTYRPEIPLSLKPLIREIVKANKGIENQKHEYKMSLNDADDVYTEIKITKTELSKTARVGSLSKTESISINCD